MIRYMATVLLVTLSLAGCQTKPPEPKPDDVQLKADLLRKYLEPIYTPVAISDSKLLGLTEPEVLKKLGLDKLNPEPGTTNKKWFPAGYVQFAYYEGCVLERCHVLTFENGRVLRDEIVDGVKAWIEVRPPQP